jgi:hypothetical protein
MVGLRQAEEEAWALAAAVAAHQETEVMKVAEEAARQATQEEAARVAAQEAAAAAAAREVAQTEELVEEAAAAAAAREEMATDHRRWDEDMPRQGAPARSTNSPVSGATASGWLIARPSVPARATARAQTPSTPAGVMPSCRRLQAKDGGTASRDRIV